MQKTVKITYTDAALITCTARADMPEAGIKQGEKFYLARSSQNDGTYYIIAWNGVDWLCRCPATKPCKHQKALAAHRVAEYLQQKATLKAASPALASTAFVSIATKGSLAGAHQGFSLLK